MGSFYRIDGRIPVDAARPGFAEALKNLAQTGEACQLSPLYNEGNDTFLAGDGAVYVSIWGDMSGGTACAWGEMVEDFASKFATEPATFTTEWEGSQDPLYVGPPGFDPLQSEIEDLQGQIEGLNLRIVDLRSRQC